MGFYQYRRSDTVQVMKKTKETIEGNYSSEQYMASLDTMFLYAVEPIIRSSNYFDKCLASLIPAQLSKPTTKFSKHKREDFLAMVSDFLSEKDFKRKAEIFKDIGLHRQYTVLFITRFLSALDGFRKDYLAEKDTSQAEKRVFHVKGFHDDLFACLHQTSYWFEYAVRFRSMILEKYHRLVVNEAVFLYKKLSHSVDLDDLTQLMLTEALRAIDRCDTEKGPITTYLQSYLRFSGKKINFEFDSAYAMNGEKRQDFTHKSQELKDDSLEQSGEHLFFSDSDYIRYLARQLDPVGVARYHLEIEEFIPALLS